MKHLRFFGTFLFSTKILLCCLFLFSFSISFISPTTAFAQTASGTANVAPITATDIARWKNYADVSFADPTYAMYKKVFHDLADMIFAKYANVGTEQGFQYLMEGVPFRKDFVKYGSADIYGVRELAREEDGSNGTGNGRELAPAVIARLNEMQRNETLFFQQSTGKISQEQYKELTNASAVKAQKSVDSTVQENAKKCTNFLSDFTSCIDEGFAWLITHTLLAFAGYFLWVTATMMNYAINIGILQFSSWAPETLYPIWIIIRQIVSLFVVFAGLWLGFMYIINQGDNFKKYIPKIVTFALFVNFSYPLVRTVIDISNVISLNLYASAVGNKALEADAVNILGDHTAGAIIRDRLGLSGLIDFATGDTKLGESALNSINSTPAALLAVLFILYAAWIFFLISALIITRTAVLVFLIVASPVLFVDGIIPKLGEKAADLRKIFWEQLFVGPVFAVMLAITLKFLEVFQKGPLASGSIGGKASSIVMFFNILMMLIMLHIMLKVIKATSGKIGESVTGAMGKVGGTLAGGAILGGAGALGRATLGRAAAAARDSGWVKNNQTNFIGRKARDMSASLANKTFDGRNSSFVKSKMADVGMTLGMGGKMGYEQVIDAREKDRVERFDYLGKHSKNVYNENGKLLHKKGDLDNSVEATKRREEYVTSAGGLNTGVRSVFTGTQEQNDVKKTLEDKKNKDMRQTLQDDKNKASAKLADMKLEDGEDRKAIEGFINDPSFNPEERKRLESQYTKKILESYSKLEDETTRKTFRALYTSVAGAPSSKNFEKLNDAEISRKVDEYNATKNTSAGKVEKNRIIEDTAPELKDEVVAIAYKKALEEYKKMKTTTATEIADRDTFVNSQSDEIRDKIRNHEIELENKKTDDQTVQNFKRAGMTTEEKTLAQLEDLTALFGKK